MKLHMLRMRTKYPNNGDVSHVCASCDDNVLDQSIRRDHEMSNGYEDDGSIDDCDDKGDEDEDEERDPNFLAPIYINQPDPDDLCALKWVKIMHYMRYLPSMKRKRIRKAIQSSCVC